MSQNSFGREKIADGVYFSHVYDQKFYSNRISINLVVPLAAETAAEYAIVPSILRLGCRTCPDQTVLNRRLGLLYGASLDGGAASFGEMHVLSVFIKGIDRRVALHGENMAALLGELLCDVVLDPLVEDGGFRAGYTEIEKNNLIDTIESELNDKRVYAQNQCVSLLFGDSPRALRPYGTVESARRITPQSAYAAYRRLMETARIEILFVGSGDYEPALSLFRERFASLTRSPAPVQRQAPVFPEKMLEQTEQLEVAQGKLVLAFSSSPKDERELSALRLMSAMYGGTPFSKLFLNVREKLSLCYYCSARYDRGNQLMMVSSGVEHEKKGEAYDEILRQLDALREGSFTDEEMKETLLLTNTSFASVGDSLYALGNWYLTQLLIGSESGVLSPAEEQERMAAVTREEVIAAARAVRLDAVYFLTGGTDAADRMAVTQGKD